jgi:hypothetical protein
MCSTDEMTERPLGDRAASAYATAIEGRTTMTLRKIRIALVATMLALTAMATIPLHSPAQAGIILNGLD